MPSYVATNQSAPVVLPPPGVVGKPALFNTWFLTRSPAGRQSYMNYMTSTINGLSPNRKKQFNKMLASQGLNMDMLRTDLPGLHGDSGLGFMQLLNLGTSLLLAKDAQDAAEDNAKDNIKLQRELNAARLKSDERMNQAMIDAKVKAAEAAAGSSGKASELQAYTAILGMQMKADTDAKRQEMFGPIWGRVIQWGAIGALVIGGGATFMYFRKKRRK